ncbi:hypothetical protein [Streptomyces zagrosensis]|uniref:C2H2-type domain-containing protein n=1 Tax=Streptomyces zagrosensis TaxID=1042984 RepID=A0A7W9QDV5_9ACTN|nr:hypothetical protein [Streptomyces zagrosensis]MBB5938316.1 hypothetical protein [Streptomyces zagrosensis]
MSESAGTPGGSHSIAQALAQSNALARTQALAYGDVGAEPVVHEAYAFACMRCGYGWEQSYDIEHHADALGQPHVSYHTDGERVPSPLTRPSCVKCGAHIVRIMRSGQVSSVSSAAGARREQAPRQRTVDRGVPSAARGKGPGLGGALDGPGLAPTPEPAAGPPTKDRGNHWHLADIWPFHRK